MRRTAERWLGIPGWPRYEASSRGRIRHAVTKRVRKLHWNASFHGWQINLEQYVGHLHFTRRTYFAHQLVAMTFLGPCPKGCEVNHKDNNTSNNSDTNLEYLTHLENMRYAAKQGRMARGERASHSKLTADQVRQIRRLYRKGSSEFGTTALGRRFGVCDQSIFAIIKGQNWAWLK